METPLIPLLIGVYETLILNLGIYLLWANHSDPGKYEESFILNLIDILISIYMTDYASLGPGVGRRVRVRWSVPMTLNSFQ